jgi:hypothetical protein
MAVEGTRDATLVVLQALAWKPGLIVEVLLKQYISASSTSAPRLLANIAPDRDNDFHPFKFGELEDEGANGACSCGYEESFALNTHVSIRVRAWA